LILNLSAIELITFSIGYRFKLQLKQMNVNRHERITWLSALIKASCSFVSVRTSLLNLYLTLDAKILEILLKKYVSTNYVKMLHLLY